jgi:hypothetical protein
VCTPRLRACTPSSVGGCRPAAHTYVEGTPSMLQAYSTVCCRRTRQYVAGVLDGRLRLCRVLCRVCCRPAARRVYVARLQHAPRLLAIPSWRLRGRLRGCLRGRLRGRLSCGRLRPSGRPSKAPADRPPPTAPRRPPSPASPAAAPLLGACRVLAVRAAQGFTVLAGLDEHSGGPVWRQTQHSVCVCVCV